MFRFRSTPKEVKPSDPLKELKTLMADPDESKMMTWMETHKYIINVKDADGFTPLILACLHEKYNVVKFLLENNADVNARNIRGTTPFIAAVHKGNVYVANSILNKMDVKFASINTPKTDGYTALMIASEHGNQDMVKFLVENGANVNAINVERNNAIMLASKGGHMEIVKLLAENGGQFEVQDNAGYTALMIASLNGHQSTVNLLLDKGAIVNTINKYKDNALMLASAEGHTGVVGLLLKNGADVNARNVDRQNAIMIASENKKTDVVELLKASLKKKGGTMRGPRRNKHRKLTRKRISRK